MLGNDVAGEEPAFVAPKEVVAAQKSTKKDGVPPKADKTKAKGGKPKASGNEAGAKFQNKNRDQSAPASTPRKGSKDKKFDRHSRTGRTESAKSEHQKLGDEAESQLEGEADAEVDAEAEEAEDSTPKVPLVSAADYFKANAPVVAEKKEAAVEIDSDKLIIKEVEVLLESTSGKKAKAQKAQKAKKFLDVNFSFADSTPQREERPAREFKNNSAKKPFNKKKAASTTAAPKSANKLTEKNFPSL